MGTTKKTIGKTRDRYVTADNWKPVYTKILYYVQKGMSDDKIAELVGYSSPITVKRVRTSDYFKERLRKAVEAYEVKRSQRLADIQSEDKTLSKLERSARSAATILVKALKGDGSITKQQIDVAKDLLDRTGYKAKEKIELETHDRVYTPEEIESAQATIIEMQSTLERLSVRGTRFLLTRGKSGVASRPDTDNDEADEVQEEDVSETAENADFETPSPSPSDLVDPVPDEDTDESPRGELL